MKPRGKIRPERKRRPLAVWGTTVLVAVALGGAGYFLTRDDPGLESGDGGTREPPIEGPFREPVHGPGRPDFVAYEGELPEIFQGFEDNSKFENVVDLAFTPYDDPPLIHMVREDGTAWRVGLGERDAGKLKQVGGDHGLYASIRDSYGQFLIRADGSVGGGFEEDGPVGDVGRSGVGDRFVAS